MTNETIDLEQLQSEIEGQKTFDDLQQLWRKVEDQFGRDRAKRKEYALMFRSAGEKIFERTRNFEKRYLVFKSLSRDPFRLKDKQWEKGLRLRILEEAKTFEEVMDIYDSNGSHCGDVVAFLEKAGTLASSVNEHWLVATKAKNCSEDLWIKEIKKIHELLSVLGKI